MKHSQHAAVLGELCSGKLVLWMLWRLVGVGVEATELGQPLCASVEWLSSFHRCAVFTGSAKQPQLCYAVPASANPFLLPWV